MKLNFNLVIAMLTLSLLGVVSSAQPAFSQETNQAEVARKLKAKVEPRYPDLARQLHLEGKVRVQLTISSDGRVKDAHVLGGSPVLSNAALDAIRQWKYESAAKETTAVVEIDFKDPRRWSQLPGPYLKVCETAQ
jgi:TonB family protein